MPSRNSQITKAGNAKPIGQYGGELYESEISDGSRVVKTYAILWSPAAAPARRLLCYDTDKPTPSCPADGPHLPDHRAAIIPAKSAQIASLQAKLR